MGGKTFSPSMKHGDKPLLGHGAMRELLEHVKTQLPGPNRGRRRGLCLFQLLDMVSLPNTDLL